MRETAHLGTDHILSELTLTFVFIFGDLGDALHRTSTLAHLFHLALLGNHFLHPPSINRSWMPAHQTTSKEHLHSSIVIFVYILDFFVVNYFVKVII